MRRKSTRVKSRKVMKMSRKQSIRKSKKITSRKPHMRRSKSLKSRKPQATSVNTSYKKAVVKLAKFYFF